MFNFEISNNDTFSLLINAIEQSNNTVVITDTNGNIEFVNKQFTVTTGYTKEDAIGQNPRILKSGRQNDSFYKELWDTITNGKTWIGEFQNKRKDGTIYWEQATISPIFDTNGNIKHYLAIKLDITKQKEIEFKLADRELTYKHLIEQLPQGFLSLDTDGIIVLVNEQFADYARRFSPAFHFSIGDSFFEISHSFVQEIQRHINDTKTAESIVFEYTPNDKQTYSVQIYKTLNHINIPLGTNILIDDITEKKQYEKAIIDAKNAAEYHNNLKNRFLSNITHEIRTPLNSILGFSQLILDETQNPNHKEYLNIIMDSSQHLLNLISDLIDISKIEAGKLEINKKPIPISKLIYFLKASFHTEINHFKKENLQFSLDLPDNYEDIVIETDINRLNQIFSNLLTNAIKYSNEGTITFGFSVESENEIIFWIKDQGIGIDASYKDSIFNRFFRIPSDNAQQYGGTGLGLSIVKELVKNLNGKIYFTSEPGKGTSFFVKFHTKIHTKNKPNDISQSQQQHDAIKSSPSNKDNKLTILIVEDIKHNTLLLKTLLKKYASKIIVAKDGIEAIDKFKDYANQLDLILMDLRLPLLSGFEATKIIRQINADIPIIAITASAYESDKAQALEAGCTAFIEKPIQKEKLLNLIDKLAK